MELNLRREWKRRLAPKLSSISGVTEVGLGNFGLSISLKEDSQQTREAIEAVFEAECPDLAYVIKVTGPVNKTR